VRGCPSAACDRASLRSRPLAGFIEPCLPRPADRPPAGSDWLHEIKHDGFRIMALRDAADCGRHRLRRDAKHIRSELISSAGIRAAPLGKAPCERRLTHLGYGSAAGERPSVVTSKNTQVALRVDSPSCPLALEGRMAPGFGPRSCSRPRPRASSRRLKLATTRRGVRAWLPLSAFNPMPPFSDRRGSR
jgi:hypothetical protein